MEVTGRVFSSIALIGGLLALGVFWRVSDHSPDHVNTAGRMVTYMSPEAAGHDNLPPNQYVVRTDPGTFVFRNRDAYHKAMMLKDGVSPDQAAVMVMPYLVCVIARGTHVVLLDYDASLPEARVLDGDNAGCFGVVYRDHLER